MTVNRIDVICTLPACTRSRFVTSLSRAGPDDGGLTWRHGAETPWEHGILKDGIADYYSAPTHDPAKMATRSHTLPDGGMVFRHHVCGDGFTLNSRNVQRIADLIVQAGKRSVSLNGLRALAANLNQQDRQHR